VLTSLRSALEARAAAEADCEREPFGTAAWVSARSRRDTAIGSIDSLTRSAEKLGISTEARNVIDREERRAFLERSERRYAADRD
jgi:hypothetical protein